MLKFGKRPPKLHRKTLHLKDYLTKEILPPPPVAKGWEYAVADGQWGMLGNDTVGDCVIAAMLHWIQAARANNGEKVMFTTEQALSIYSAITGYDPSQTQEDGSNPTDNGTAWTDALAYWQKTGVCGHKILGWAAIEHSDLSSIKQAIALFGGVLIGTNVTSSMEAQFSDGQPWNAPFSNDSLGGHGIPWLGYGRVGQTCITWGQREQMAPEALEQVDEAYVPITADWLDTQGNSPSGLNLASLKDDLKLIAS